MNNNLHLSKGLEEHLKDMVGDVFLNEFNERRHLYPYIEACNLMFVTLDYKYNIPFDKDLISDKMEDLMYFELEKFFGKED